jgi:hypothetical protein
MRKINCYSFVFSILHIKILSTMQSLTPNIGGLREFQVLELQGLVSMDDVAPSMELP